VLAEPAAEAHRHFCRRLHDALNSKWMEDAEHDTQQKRIRLNIGGQVFETTLDVLTREPSSKLARVAERFATEVDDALASARAASEQTPSSTPHDTSQAVAEVDALVPSLQLGAGHSGAFPGGAADAVDPPFFDRDWWLFRYLLQALREGSAALPQDPALLKQLFDEAAYWRLTEMQEHMRTLYMRVAARQAESEASLAKTSTTGMPAGSQSMGTQALLATAMSRAAAAQSQSQQQQQQPPALESTYPASGQYYQGQQGLGSTAPWQPVAPPAAGALRPGMGGPGIPPGGALPPPSQYAPPHWNYSGSQPWPTNYGGTSSSAAGGLAAKAALVGFGSVTPPAQGAASSTGVGGGMPAAPTGYPPYTLPTQASAYAAAPTRGFASQAGGPFPVPAGGVAASAGLSTSAGWPASSAMAASYGMGATMGGYGQANNSGSYPAMLM